MSRLVARQSRARRWQPEVSETQIALNDNIRLTIQSIHTRRRPHDPLLKYQITRLNQSADPSQVSSSIQTPSLANYSTIIAGKFEPTPVLLKAACSRTTNNGSPTAEAATIDDPSRFSINLPGIASRPLRVLPSRCEQNVCAEYRGLLGGAQQYSLPYLSRIE